MYALNEPVELADDTDIYRGEPSVPHRPSSVQSIAPSSSSSSGSFFTGGRLGAIASVVEQAISRWARANASSSSLSSSSTAAPSIRSSIFPSSRSGADRRRRRRATSVDRRNTASERDVAARLKARQEARHIPRQFTLSLPPDLRPDNAQLHASRHADGSGVYEHLSHTSSLPIILSELETALKKSVRIRRSEHKSRQRTAPPILHHDYMLPESIKVPSRAASFADLTMPRSTNKGKNKDARRTLSTIPNTVGSVDQPENGASKAWWLDVASPTWDDLRAIGKLLHLHPLTLEDILQQDPREKLELFPRLGYYFIVFRAIESRASSDRFRQRISSETDGHMDEGVLGEVNVYLAVFKDGICTFHFSDMSEHIDRVRNRVKMLHESFNMSSDWIAHGILDSIVDSFFPYLEEIEKEVASAERSVFSDNGHVDVVPSRPSAVTAERFPSLHSIGMQRDAEKLATIIEEKYDVSGDTTASLKTHFSLPHPSQTLFFRRIQRKFHSIFSSVPSTGAVRVKPSNKTTTTLLRRMARARRLVTTLTRLLATKAEVVSQIRKRLLTAGQSKLTSEAVKNDDVEIAIHMGDVQDHIITLLNSFIHYETMLSQSHPAYLFQLRIAVAKTKTGTDRGILILTTVSLSVLCIQTIIGIFSMNVQIPANALVTWAPYDMFGVVIALASLVLCGFLSTVRFFWLQAKRRRARVL